MTKQWPDHNHAYVLCTVNKLIVETIRENKPASASNRDQQDSDMEPDYSHGWNLLMRSHRQDVQRAIETLRTRPTAQFFLENIPASRSSTYQNHEKDPRRSLPGVGHEYWHQVRDHLQARFPPPTLDLDLSAVKTSINQTIANTIVSMLKVQWQADQSYLCKCEFEHCMVLSTNDDCPVLRIPVVRNSIAPVITYQNGQPAEINNFVAFHGTRQALVPSILQNGLMSSIHSHGVTGLWVNSNVCTSLAWTSSIFDMIPSIALEVVAPCSAKRQNKRIKAGNPERMVVELTHGSLPPLHIAAIICTIPNAERVSFHASLKQVIMKTSEEWWNAQTSNKHNITLQELVKFMWELCSFRYAYIGTPGALSTTFGAVWNQIPQCIILPSIHFVAVLFYLHELTSHDNKTQKLSTVTACMMPQTMQTFVRNLAPSIDEFWDIRNNRHKRSECILDLVSVQKWGPIESLEETSHTSHLFQA